jgi:hypothetical protein
MEFPDFAFAKVGFTAFGVIALYGRLSVKDLRPFVLPRLIPSKVKGGWRRWTEFTIFVAFGTAFAIVFVDPETTRQCIAAGFGWTTLGVTPGGVPKGEGT